MNKKLIEAVKLLFRKENFADEPVNKMVKTKDGDIFMVKDTEVKVDAMIVKMDQDEEVAIENGDYTLEDESVLTITDGKIEKITPKAVEEEEVVVEAKDEEVKMTAIKQIVKFSVIKQVSKWAFDVDQDNITVGTILTQTWKMEDGTDGEPLPISAGEYENEAGDKVQVDAEGKVVLITKAGAVVEAPVVEEEVVAESEEMKAIKAELVEIKLAKEKAELEAKEANEKFEKLKKSPAAKVIDTKNFEKTDSKNAPKEFKFSKDANLSAVQEILRKK